MATATTKPNIIEHNSASFQDVRQDVDALRRDVKQFASDSAHVGMDAVKAGATRAREKARDYYSEACDYVAEHPIAAVLIAAGAGAILVRLLSRRH